MRVIVVTGPTATGKTRLGIELAKMLNGEIVSADSMQVYRGMDIGTAKPDQEEMSGIPHYMIDVAEATENYSAARYVTEGAAVLEDILTRGKLPVIVGGTGLYIDSLLRNRKFLNGNASLRAELSERYDSNGAEALFELLREVDPESAERLHINDKKRVVRALEVYSTTGKTISEHNYETSNTKPRYEALILALNYNDRAKLYEKIDNRVDEMVKKGLFEEVEKLIDSGVSMGNTAMQAIGYKECAAVLSGKISREEGIEAVKRETRRYAKRQLTWLRQKEGITWLLFDDKPDITQAYRYSTAFVEK